MKQKQVNVALPDALRQKLDAAASAAGHSIAEEMRLRLQLTVELDDMDNQTRETAGSLMSFADLVEQQIGFPWHAHKTAHEVFSQLVQSWLHQHRPYHFAGPGGVPEVNAPWAEGDATKIAAMLYRIGETFNRQDIGRKIRNLGKVKS